MAGASDPDDDRPILVGVEPGLPTAVISVAEELATGLGCEVVFAYVELNSALIELDPEGVRATESLDPEVDDEMASIVRELGLTLAAALRDSLVPWSLRTLGGDPASALSRLAMRSTPASSWSGRGRLTGSSIESRGSSAGPWPRA